MSTWSKELITIFAAIAFYLVLPKTAQLNSDLGGEWCVGQYAQPGVRCAARVSGAPVKSLQHINHFISCA